MTFDISRMDALKQAVIGAHKADGFEFEDTVLGGWAICHGDYEILRLYSCPEGFKIHLPAGDERLLDQSDLVESLLESIRQEMRNFCTTALRALFNTQIKGLILDKSYDDSILFAFQLSTVEYLVEFAMDKITVKQNHNAAKIIGTITQMEKWLPKLIEVFDSAIANGFDKEIILRD